MQALASRVAVPTAFAAKPVAGGRSRRAVAVRAAASTATKLNTQRSEEVRARGRGAWAALRLGIGACLSLWPHGYCAECVCTLDDHNRICHLPHLPSLSRGLASLATVAAQLPIGPELVSRPFINVAMCIMIWTVVHMTVHIMDQG